MDWTREEGSSLIAGYAWESNRPSLRRELRTGTLGIEFVDGSRWMYFEVPELLWDAFLFCNSKGSFFRQQVQGWFKEMKVEDYERRQERV